MRDVGIRSWAARPAFWRMRLQSEEVFMEARTMARTFRRGDHVEWNSEAGLVRGTIQKVVTSEITFKGYQRHASKQEPQYVIKSDKTDHLAMHKGSALKKIPGRT